MATDIAARSLELSDGWGTGYKNSGSPTSPRYTVTKSITDLGTGKARITLTVTVKTNDGYLYSDSSGANSLTFHLTVGGVTVTALWRATTATWNKNSTYTGSISIDVDMSDASSRSARLWTTAGDGSNIWVFDTSTQGGTTIDGIPLLAGIVWIGNASGTPIRGEVYVGNANGVPVKAKQVWIGNSSGTPVRAKPS